MIQNTNTSFAAYWRAVANGTRKRMPDRLLVLLLIPFSLIYAVIQYTRAEFYRSGLFTTKRLPRPVISIGNITVGGTGKTPATAYIARFLMARGLNVAVLSRGYGGSLEGNVSIVSDGVTVLLEPEQCGDEPFLLARTNPGLMVVIGADRYEAGMLAIDQLSPDIFILDDGFQHLRLHRDLDILLLDYRCPYGNGWTLPAGLLREPETGIGRTDLVMYTRCPDTLRSSLTVPGKMVCYARHQLCAVRPFAEDVWLPFSALKGRTFLAFAGIAEPQYFFDGLRTLGLNVVAIISFPDHAAYTEFQIAEISSAMQTSGADSIITTEKDGVKLKHLSGSLSEKILIARLELALDDPAPLAAALLKLLQK
ncbi:MAG: tetraacyldisaccharide 4'-kinase [Geobacteraceae bacterium]|nr:tetraacyldisaccharide 4'-kinase [Geobacteraceae bacterium]